MRKLATMIGALASVGALVLLTGCGGFGVFGGLFVRSKAPVSGSLFTAVQAHDNATENPIGAKNNKICATGLLGRYAFGSAAVVGAAGADIKEVSVVDSDIFTLLSLYQTHCTIVHDGSGAAPAAAPGAAPVPGATPAAPGAAPTAPGGVAPGAPVAPTTAAPGGAPAPPAGKTI